MYLKIASSSSVVSVSSFEVVGSNAMTRVGPVLVIASP